MHDVESTHSAQPPLSIVYIARGGDIDGASRQLIYLLSNLDRSRFKPLVIVDRPGPILDALCELNVPVKTSAMRPWRSLRGLPFRRLDARAALRIARSRGASIVHCSDPWRGPYAAYVASRLSVPLVAHVRGPTSPRDLKKNHVLHAKHVIGIAERYRAEILDAGYPSNQISIVDDAVDPAVYRPDESLRRQVRSELQIGNRLGVGLVGRIEPLKRVVEFLDAVALVPRDIDAMFLLIGSTRKCDYLAEVERRIVTHRLCDRVRIVGRRDDMPAVLGSLDLLVTLSGGSVMFEAMACDTCVLSVRADGRHSLHTIHNQTAACVTSDRPQPAADAITELARDEPLRTRLARAGRACVIERLSPATMARNTQRIYEQLFER